MINKFFCFFKRLKIFNQLKRKGVSFLDRGKPIDVLSCEFEGNNVIRPNVTLYNVKVGFGSYISNNSYFCFTSIGRYSCIGPYVHLIEGRHPSRGFVSIHPAFFSTNKQSGFTFVDQNLFIEHKYADQENGLLLIIGNDVWIGAHALLLEGITIGDGAIIAAGSVVTRDVQPYEVVAGNPAKRIRMRFEEDDIDYLKRIRWWDYPVEQISAFARSFESVDVLRKRIESENEI